MNIQLQIRPLGNSPPLVLLYQVNKFSKVITYQYKILMQILVSGERTSSCHCRAEKSKHEASRLVQTSASWIDN